MRSACESCFSAEGKRYVKKEDLFLCEPCVAKKMCEDTKEEEKDGSSEIPLHRNRRPLCDNCKGKLASAYCRVEGAYFCVQCDSILHGASRTASKHERLKIEGPIPLDFVEQANKQADLLDARAALGGSQYAAGQFSTGTPDGQESLPPLWMNTEPSSTTSGEAVGPESGFGNVLDTFSSDFGQLFDIDPMSDSGMVQFPQEDKPTSVQGSSSPVAHLSTENRRSASPGVTHSPTADHSRRSLSPDSQGALTLNDSGRTSSGETKNPSGGRTQNFLQAKSPGMKRTASTPALSSLQYARQQSLPKEPEDGAAKPPVNPLRAAQLQRYRHKRFLRLQAAMSGHKKIRYACRKTLADNRPRVKGRFAKVSEPLTMADVEKTQSLPRKQSASTRKDPVSTKSKASRTKPVKQELQSGSFGRSMQQSNASKEPMDMLMFEESRDVLGPLNSRVSTGGSMDRSRGFSPDFDDASLGWLLDESTFGDDGGFLMPSGPGLKRCFSDGALLSLDADDLICDDFIREELVFQEGMVGDNGQ